MANLLKAQAIGRLTRDPHSGDDKETGVYCLLSIAVNRKSGNDEETTFIDVSVRGKQAESCADQLSSGDEIYVDGTASLREFEKKDRTLDKVLRINASTVQFLSVKKWSEGGGNNSRNNDEAPRGRGGNGGGGRGGYNGRSGNGGGGNGGGGNARRTTSRF
jgi:single-strand DNA-binding protein